MEDKVKKRLGDKIVSWEKRSDRRYYVEVKREDLVESARILFKDLGMRFATASGVENPGQFEILYHFACDTEGKFFSLRVGASKEKPVFPSISGIIQGAKWIEREIHELLGIDFSGHPGLERLLLAENWPEGVYPLRKDFSNDQKPG